RARGGGARSATSAAAPTGPVAGGPAATPLEARGIGHRDRLRRAGRARVWPALRGPGGRALGRERGSGAARGRHDRRPADGVRAARTSPGTAHWNERIRAVTPAGRVGDGPRGAAARATRRGANAG